MLSAMKTALITLCFLLVLGGVVAYATHVWTGVGDVEISWLGILALVGGSLLTFALGAGLMALVFYSNRRGHDDEAGR
jgi:hypothetical protein